MLKRGSEGIRGAMGYWEVEEKGDILPEKNNYVETEPSKNS